MGLHRRTPSVNRAMANEFHAESQPLTRHVDAQEETAGRPSASSASTTSLVLEHISDKDALQAEEALYNAPQDDMEEMAWQRQHKPSDQKARRIFYVLIAVGLVGWVAAFFLFLSQDRHVTHSARPHDPHATATQGNGKKVTLDQVLTGQWSAHKHEIQWIAGPSGEDGLLLERGGEGGRDYLVVEDVRYRGDDIETQKSHSKTLMKYSDFQVGKEKVTVHEAWPSPDHKKVLVRSDYTSNWRHSGTGRYWIFDVETQTGEALDPNSLYGRVQVAQWSPQSNAVAFTRDNNLFIRHLDASEAQRITNDGGSELFYGVPDWVYEEEVLAGDSATWWDGDGKFVAFFRTDESQVPNYPVQYFFSSPTGAKKQKGQENYPETREIKYPKAGASNPLVSLQFYDVDKGDVFTVPIEDDFAEDDRIITEVVWAGKTGKVIVRSTNREQDILKTILIDATARSGKTVRERDVQKLDGGWFEITESTTFVPADAASGRSHDGYVDTIIHDGFDHLAYFSPLDSAEPQMLTEGEWEVVKAPSAVDMRNNLVYFVSTKHGSTQRHIYTVDLLKGPSSIEAVTDTSSIGYYEATFSAGSHFMLLSYAGPDIPFQKVLATPSNKGEDTDIMIETNPGLKDLAQRSELPIKVFSTVNVDGYDLNIVERRPPHFDPKKKYPVLFYLYNGPGFQLVDRKFTVDFESYVASSLGYIVVSLDGLGTGYLGRKQRTIIRSNLGYWEAYSQIAAAKQLAKKQYIDPDRMAIWGWSYGGFMSLKTLEQDAGQTFKYGMAVAPVTDWRYYDSIYTERYMHTPQHNPGGYENASISNATALSQNVRFLVMHGFSDDNVHFQNTLSLLDKLDLANVRNYDVHVFPDSDHSIFFHNGNRVVYEKLRDWLVNAFNGEWLKTEDPKPAGVLGGG